LLCWYIGQKLVSIASPADPQVKLSPQSLVLAGNIAQALMPVFCLIVAQMTFVTGRTGLGIGRRAFTRDLLPAVAGWLAANAICSLLYWLSLTIWLWLYPSPVLPEHMVVTVLADPATSAIIRVVAVVGAIILAPVGEELLFRGILQSGVKKLVFVRWGSWRHRWIAIAVTAAIFGLVHTGTPHHIPSLIALGVILGYLYERSGSLVLPILVHMLFNGKTLLWMAIG
jgi:membrane protease YdiL (CAAX protease family)